MKRIGGKHGNRKGNAQPLTRERGSRVGAFVRGGDPRGRKRGVEGGEFFITRGANKKREKKPWVQREPGDWGTSTNGGENLGGKGRW